MQIMAYSNREVITTIQPFDDLTPLTEYLASLDAVTQDPTDAAVVQLRAADKTLTDRAVLFPATRFVSGEGQRVIGYEACTASDGVTYAAQETDSTLESRTRAARGALITLGGHLAVSGAFHDREIPAAYASLRASLELLGTQSDRADYAAFGLKRIGRDLLNQYWVAQHLPPEHLPISKRDAVANIKTAWEVTGRPFGPFARVVSAVAGLPTF